MCLFNGFTKEKHKNRSLAMESRGRSLLFLAFLKAMRRVVVCNELALSDYLICQSAGGGSSFY